MEIIETFSNLSTSSMVILCIIALWDVVWKLIGMWRAARDSNGLWFICIAIFNTVGILPLIYILTHPKK